MPTKIIAVFNIAGGVAKSTICHNLSYHLAQKSNVLAIDMDQQGSLTRFMGVEPQNLQTEETVYSSVVSSPDEAPPLPIWQESIYGVDLVPGNMALSSLDEKMKDSGLDYHAIRLRTAINNLQKEYDYILIDCPPNKGIHSMLALFASTHVLVPIQCHVKSYAGTVEITKVLTNVIKSGHKLKIAAFVPSIYSKGTRLESGFLEQLKEDAQGNIHVTCPIPRTVAIPESQSKAKPLALHKPKHGAVAALEEISTYIASLN
ncbi:MAG: ParA family protein [Cyanobacteria bacterium J06639_18]